jgi:hypothetical protein
MAVTYFVRSISWMEAVGGPGGPPGGSNCPSLLGGGSGSGKKSRSRPTSPAPDSSGYMHGPGSAGNGGSMAALGKLEELNLHGSSSGGSSGGGNIYGTAVDRRETKGHLPPLPHFTSPHKNSDFQQDGNLCSQPKPRRSINDEEQTSPFSPGMSPGAFNSLSPSEKGSPSESKSSPGNSAKGIPSPEQRRQSVNHQLPHLDKDSLPRRSRTPEPLDALTSAPPQRHVPVLGHLNSELSPISVIAGSGLTGSSRRSRTPEPDLMSLPSFRHAPALAHLEKEPSLSAPSSARRSRTPEPCNDLRSVPGNSQRHAQPLEHLERGPGNSRDFESIVRKLEISGDDHGQADKYHLHDHLSEHKPRRMVADSKDNK